MPPIGKDENPWVFVHEMRIDGCRGVGHLDIDTSSSEDGFVCCGNDNAEYKITNETSSGNCIVGSLSSDTSSSGHSVSPPPSLQRLGFDGRDARDPYAVYSYTAPRGGTESIPRSCLQVGEWNMLGTSPDLLIQRAEGPLMDLNEENLGILHPHFNGREKLSETEEWLQRNKCSGKAIPTLDSVRSGIIQKSEHRKEISHAPKAKIADTSQFIQQYTPDTTGRSGPAHRQIDAQIKPRTSSTTGDEEDANKARKKTQSEGD